MTRLEFIYRATSSDGAVTDTQPRTYRPGQRSFVGVAVAWERKRRNDPGLTGVRLLREVRDDVTGPWKPDTHPDWQ